MADMQIERVHLPWGNTSGGPREEENISSLIDVESRFLLTLSTTQYEQGVWWELIVWGRDQLPWLRSAPDWDEFRSFSMTGLYGWCRSADPVLDSVHQDQLKQVLGCLESRDRLLLRTIKRCLNQHYLNL